MTAPPATPSSDVAGRGSRSELVVRLRSALVASDPGRRRLRTAGTTVLTLAVALGLLYVLTDLVGQSFTVALLGVVISMISSMAFKGARPLDEIETGGLMLVVAAAAVSLGAVLAPHKLAGDVVFVAIMTAATAGRRFGPRSTSVGMVAFMTYFFALFLGATVALLPWLIGALAVGTAVSLALHLALREDPDVQVRRAMDALRSGVALVVDLVADGLAAQRWTERDRARLRGRMAGVSRTALMIDGEIEDRADGSPPDGLAIGVFDVELATEHLVGAWERAAAAEPSAGVAGAPATTLAAVSALRVGLRPGAAPGLLTGVEAAGGAVRSQGDPTPWRVLEVALAQLAGAVTRVGSVTADEAVPPGETDERDAPTATATADADVATAAGTEADGGWFGRLAPSTRQAIQVAVASSLAIVAGTQLSSARWYWAVIATFTIYSGTTSRGETLTRGWQRVVGTVAGVAVGAVVASLVAGNVTVSIVLIFVALFTGFYLMRISYAFMVLGMSTMLALLYGLLGEFTVGLLVTRIEETAIGAGIGIAVAVLVLPTATPTVVRRDLRAVLDGLAELLARTSLHLAGGDGGELVRTGRELDGRLQTLAASARPLTSGLTSQRTRNTVREGLRILTACDRYARGLVRVAGVTPPDAGTEALRALADHVRDNVVTLTRGLGDEARDGPRPGDGVPAAGRVSVAPTALPGGGSRTERLAARYLVQLDRAVVDLSGVLRPGDAGRRAGSLGVTGSGKAGRAPVP